MVGKLTGFSQPYGQCVDKKGDVWIVNFGSASAVEYAHGAQKPMRRLSTNAESIGCSIDPVTGNLAVANVDSGDILVFEPHSKIPKIYSGRQCQKLWFPGYDASGNLYVEAVYDSEEFACELPLGGSGLQAVQDLSGWILSPGGVMWDGKYITLADAAYHGEWTAVYRMQEQPSGNLTEVSGTVLKDTCHAQVGQPFVVGKKNTPANTAEGNIIVGGNAACNHHFDYWKYPNGGRPSLSLKSAPAEPYGQSVSIAP